MLNKSSFNSKPSFFYATISITIVLFLSGIFLILFFHSGALTNIIKEKINIIAELEDNTNEQEVKKLIVRINAFDMVLPSSATFLSKDNALEFMEDDYTTVSDIPNPFRDVIKFNVRASEYTDANLGYIKEELEKSPHIITVFYENETIEAVKTNLQKLSYIILALSLVFIFLATIIIYNTLNIMLYVDRLKIKTMEMVGARWSFIKKPYLRSGMRLGIGSFMVAGILLVLTLLVVGLNMEGIFELVDWKYVILTFVILFVISQLITLYSTNRAVNKFLSGRTEDLYV